MLRYQAGQVTTDSLLIQVPFQISSFGVDRENELYVCSYSDGTIHRFSRGPLSEGNDFDVTVPTRYSLEQNFPNPFNPSTKIKYAIPSSEHVRLEVVDVLGRQIATLVDRVEQPGYKSIEFAASSLSSGIYFYRLKAGSFEQTNKMIVLK
jgi:hypothetical protein